MKAMMSEKLRNILNDPGRNRELQKKLSQSSNYSEKTQSDSVFAATSCRQRDQKKPTIGS